ncbi:MAG: hypothetical protein K6G73_12470 [Marinilabiliaceae bacterium]|nr:hypothetical protein [Marinilabiliaceae bacterium]
MDFNSLGSGSPFYLLRKGEKPQLIVGTIKDKSAPMPKYQGQIFNGTAVQQVLTLTVTVNGKDEVFTNVPCNVEIAAYGNDTFSGSREAMLSAVDAMIQSSRKSLEMVDYHKSVLDEGEKMLETLNPRYAEEKKRDKAIGGLEKWKVATEGKLTALEKQNNEILTILRKLDSPSKD